MPGLDEFYRYLDRQDKPNVATEARRSEEGAGERQNGDGGGSAPGTGGAASGRAAARRPALGSLPGSAEPGVRYVLRNGVTVAVPVGTVSPASVNPEPTPEAPEAPPVEPSAEPPAEPSAETSAAAAPAVTSPAPPRKSRSKSAGASAPAAKAPAAPPADEPAASAAPADPAPDAPEYLPPIIEAHEPTQVADAPARPRPVASGRASAARDEDPLFSDADIVQMWRTLPRHIQLLVGMKSEEAEVAQKYYTRNFKESRGQLIERLLDPTLTLEDTARVLGVCPTTVRRYTNRGVLPHHRTVGQQRRFRLSDVLAFLERQQRARKRRAEKTAEALAARQNLGAENAKV